MYASPHHSTPRCLQPGTGNTLASFRLAKELGADGFECDVQLTKDHKLVIAHDFFTDAHTGVKGDIYDMTFDELRQLDFGKWKSPEYEARRSPPSRKCWTSAKT